MALNDLLGPPRWQALLVRRYPNQDIRRMFPQFEDALGSYISPQAEIYPTNESSPPNQARFGLRAKKKSLQVSNMSAELTLDFSEGVPSGGMIPVVARAAEEMDRLDDILRDQPRMYAGLLLIDTRLIAAHDLPAAQQLLAELVLKEVPTAVSTFSFAISHEKDAFTRSVQLSLQKSFTMSGVGPLPSSLTVDFDFQTEGVESALEFKIDANTRPQMESPQRGNFKKLVAVLQDMLNDEAPRYFGDQVAVK